MPGRGTGVQPCTRGHQKETQGHCSGEKAALLDPQGLRTPLSISTLRPPARRKSMKRWRLVLGEGGGTAGKQRALRLPAAAAGAGEGCAGKINRNDFQRETGRVLCMIFQFFLPPLAPCLFSDTSSSLLETHFCTECCRFSCFPGPWQLHGNGRGGEPRPHHVAGAALGVPGRRSGDRGEGVLF